MLKSLFCRINRHEPDRSAARWDGRNFVGTCVHCGATIRRKQHRVWRRESLTP